MRISIISVRRKPRCLRCHAALDDPGSSPGDPAVQDNVVKMVRLQIGQEKVKESVEEEKAKLQALADEVCFIYIPSVVSVGYHQSALKRQVHCC